MATTNETKWTPGPLTVVADIDPATPWEIQTADGLQWTARVLRKGDAVLYAAAPSAINALLVTRDNLRTLNAARVDRGIVPFDAWLAVIEDALAKAGVTT